MKTDLCDQQVGGWPTASLESICTRISSGGTPKRLTPGYYVESGGFPWVKTQELQDRVLHDTEEHISQLALDNSSAKVHPAGTLLVAMYAAPTAGRMAILGRPMACNQAACALLIDPSIADVRFVFYQLLHARPDLHRLANGAAQQNLSARVLREVEIVLPPLDEQRRIAGVLGALDDLIQVNKRLVVSLQQQSDAIYRQTIAQTGRLVPVAEIATFENNKRVPLSAAQRLANPGVYPYFGATSQMDSVGGFLFDGVRVLVGEDGSVVHPDGSPFVQYVWGRFWVNNHAHVLTGSGISTELLRVILRNANVASVITGAVQAKLSMSSLKSVQVWMPAAAAVDDAIQALAAAERELSDEVQELIQTRNELLPLLLSGCVSAREVAA